MSHKIFIYTSHHHTLILSSLFTASVHRIFCSDSSVLLRISLHQCCKSKLCNELECFPLIVLTMPCLSVQSPSSAQAAELVRTLSAVTREGSQTNMTNGERRPTLIITQMIRACQGTEWHQRQSTMKAAETPSHSKHGEIPKTDCTSPVTWKLGKSVESIEEEESESNNNDGGHGGDSRHLQRTSSNCVRSYNICKLLWNIPKIGKLLLLWVNLFIHNLLSEINLFSIWKYTHFSAF